MEIVTLYIFVLAVYMTVTNLIFVWVDKNYREFRVYGSMRLENLLRIIAEAPFMVVYLASLYMMVSSRAKNATISLVLLVLIMLFFMGYGMHWVADSIDIIQHGHELRGTELEVGAQRLAYFLDEVVSHKVLFYPLFGMFAVLLLADFRADLALADVASNVLSGVLLGGFLMLACIEGQSAIEGIVFATSVAAYSWYCVIREGPSYLTTSPVGLFSIVMSAVMLAVATAWLLKFGEFKEPHEVW